MTAKPETIAKALEISVALTKEADHTWLHTDERGFVFVKEPLLGTLKTVIRLLHSDIANITGDSRVFPVRAVREEGHSEA